MYITDNSRILSREELSTPEEITNEIPLDKESSKLIFGARSNISKILHGLDDRIIAVVGPCSIHDPKAAIDYAKKNNTTILLASHNMSEVERLCENIMMMKQGKIIDEGTCEELIFKHGRVNLEETFLKLVRG